jgi:uncharacterized DUF497 family protein
VTFTLRAEGTIIRVISARGMHRKERALYEGQSLIKIWLEEKLSA